MVEIINDEIKLSTKELTDSINELEAKKASVFAEINQRHSILAEAMASLDATLADLSKDDSEEKLLGEVHNVCDALS